MHEKFRVLVDGLDKKCQALLSMLPVVAEMVPTDTPVGGVYLFSDGEANLYAGRTKGKIAKRIRQHFNTKEDCPFAWLIARKSAGKYATYKPAGSRKSLLADSIFKAEYEHAKNQIRKMQVRYVQEQDPTKQALLEIYVATVSAAIYNDFDTH